MNKSTIILIEGKIPYPFVTQISNQLISFCLNVHEYLQVT